MSERYMRIMMGLLLAVILSACNLTTSAPQPNIQQTQMAVQVEATMTSLQATMQAAGQPAQETTALPSPRQGSEPGGSIAGKLSFPGESVPPLRIVAFEVAEGQPTGYYYYIETQSGQNAYQIDELPQATYWIIAYTLPGQGEPMAGGYTQAVRCGLTANCSDHALIEVNVNAGQVIQGVDPTDWHAPPETFPNDPVG